MVGSWSAPFDWPGVAVHLSLLPDGRVMSWGAAISGAPRIWTPGMGGFISAQSPVLIFCGGQTFLADGRLLVAGGTLTTATFGRTDINLFATDTGAWSTSVPMKKGRWYPTTTMMAGGSVVITAGTDQAAANVALPEVWNPNGTIRTLTNASLTLPYYPRTFLAPNGKLFYAGEQRMSRYLDATGKGKWTNVGNRTVGSRDYGGAAMYAPGKILYAGGGRTTNTAEIIDLNQASPTWQYTGSMAFARRHFNVTILADGKVLATDGVAGTSFNDLTQPVLPAELWDPATGVWTTMASSSIPRGYHSTAILLPDGTVLQSGGGNGGAPEPEERRDLLAALSLRRRAADITSAPETAAYRSSFSVTTPDAAAITKISLIRPGTTTHSFNMNQRYQTLDFVADAGALTVTAPTNRNLTPPGHYLLFILNAAGVPSVAKIVRIM